MRAKRRSKPQPSQVCRKKAKPKRVPTERYTPAAISHAVAIACSKAFPPPPSLARHPGEGIRRWKARLNEQEKTALLEWQRQHRWHPYQLRHSFGTRVRGNYGLEAAQVLLGHSNASTTEIYAELDLGLGLAVAAKIG